MGVLVACSAGGGGGCLLRGRCQRMDEAEVRAHAMGRPSRDSANLPRWLVKAVYCVWRPADDTRRSDASGSREVWRVE